MLPLRLARIAALLPLALPLAGCPSDDVPTGDTEDETSTTSSTTVTTGVTTSSTTSTTGTTGSTTETTSGTESSGTTIDETAGTSDSTGSGSTGSTGGTGSTGETDGTAGSTGAESVCGEHIDNEDGTCTARIRAEIDEDRSGYMQIGDDDATCPIDDSNPTAPSNGGGNNPYWTIEAYQYTDGNTLWRRSGFLGFDTSFLAGVTSIDSASVRIYNIGHVGQNDDVQLWGGTQPIFGATLESADWNAGDTLLGTVTIAEIDSSGYADFDVGVGQVNDAGDSQFRVALDRDCADFGNFFGNNYWTMERPGSENPARHPALWVTYTP